MWWLPLAMAAVGTITSMLGKSSRDHNTALKAGADIREQEAQSLGASPYRYEAAKTIAGLKDSDAATNPLGEFIQKASGGGGGATGAAISGLAGMFGGGGGSNLQLTDPTAASSSTFGADGDLQLPKFTGASIGSPGSDDYTLGLGKGFYGKDPWDIGD